MCRRIECRKCGKPSWAGCGAHIEQVLGDVPPAERCQCHEDEQPASNWQVVAPARKRSWLSRILGG